MSKAILISIRPKYVADILNGNKTIEIRKRFPKDYIGWVYIYCTKDKKYANLINRGGFLTGMVVARFWCDKVDYYEDVCFWSEENEKASCVTASEFFDYIHHIKCHRSCCLIHITNLEIFDKPKEIGEFKYYKKFSEIDYMLPIPKKETCERLVALNRAPQSWCYVEV